MVWAEEEMGQQPGCSGGRGWRVAGLHQDGGGVGWGGRPCFLDRTKDLLKRLAHGAQPPASSAPQSPQSPEVFPAPRSEGSGLEAHGFLMEHRAEGVEQLGVPEEMRIWRTKLGRFERKPGLRERSGPGTEQGPG